MNLQAGFRVWALGPEIMVQGLGLGFRGSVFRDSGFRVLRFRDLGFRV